MAAKAALNGLGRSREVSIVSCDSLLLQLVTIRFFTRATATAPPVRETRALAESEAADSVRLTSQAR
jgi:hypothetical protein